MKTSFCNVIKGVLRNLYTQNNFYIADVDSVEIVLGRELESVKSLDDYYADVCQKRLKEHRIIYVHPGYQRPKIEGRTIQCFKTINNALDYVREKRRNEPSVPYLIFVHSGTYNETINIYLDDIALIGVPDKCYMTQDSIIIQNEGTVMHVKKNMKCVYVGYLTLQQLSSSPSSVDDELPASYCLQTAESASPTIEHCIIMNANNSEYIYIVLLQTILTYQLKIFIQECKI